MYCYYINQACERRQVSSEEHLHTAQLTGKEGVIQKTTSVCDVTLYIFRLLSCITQSNMAYNLKHINFDV